MDRRSFLGSIIGTLVVRRLPFFAIASSTRNPCREIALPWPRTLPFRAFACCDDGAEFWLPVARTFQCEDKIEVATEPVAINRPLGVAVLGFGVMDWYGVTILRKAFDPVTLDRDTRLSVTWRNF